jgi:uncharacterized protein YbaP (TraB family)
MIFQMKRTHPSSVSRLRRNPPSPTRGEGLFALVAFLFLALAPPAFARAETAHPIHPALFVVRDADSTLYLFGTIHARPHGAAWGGPEAVRALSEAQEVWTELEFSSAADERTGLLIAQRGVSQNETLSSWLTPEQLAQLRARTVTMSVPFTYIDRMRPWLAALTLSMLPAMQEGYQPQAGADRMLLIEAQARGAHPRWFETPEQQVDVLSGMSEGAQRQMLLDALASGDNVVEDFGRLSDAWERGDTRLLERYVIDDLKAQYPDLYATIFRARNAAWVEALDHEMQGAGIDFVAVGAGHLLGEDGLVAQLRARGYSVERVRASR